MRLRLREPLLYRWLRLKRALDRRPRPASELGTPAIRRILAISCTALGDTLLLANDLAPVASPLNESPAAIAVRAARAARSIDCVIGDDLTLSSILAESDDEVQSLLKVLVH